MKTKKIWTITATVFAILLILNFGTFGVTLIQIGEWKLRWAGLYSHVIFSESFPVYWSLVLLILFVYGTLLSLKIYKGDVVPGFFLDKLLNL